MTSLHMMTFIACIAIFGLFVPQVSAQDAKPPAPEQRKPTIEAIGVSVVLPIKVRGEFDEPQMHLLDDELQPGTRVTMLVRSNGKNLISIEDEDSTLAFFRDDLGTDLVDEGDPVLTNWSRGANGSFATIVAQTDVLPARRARRLMLGGVLMLTFAKEQETVRQKDVALQVGNTFKIGEIDCKIGDFDANEPDRKAKMVLLDFDRNVPELIEVIFRDADGQVIPADLTYTSSSTSNGKIDSMGQGYELDRMPKKVTIEFRVWSNFERIPVPYVLNVGLGLGDDDDGLRLN